MIKIIAVGKIKEKYIKEAINDYSKRILKYTKFKIIELDDSKIEDEKVALKKEKELILKHINLKDFIVTMEIEGQSYSSLEFSQKIENIQMNYPNVTFIIGGSFGIDEEIKKISNLAISFSNITFPHQLFRVFLLEQIYRSYKIMHNESYHK